MYVELNSDHQAARRAYAAITAQPPELREELATALISLALHRVSGLDRRTLIPGFKPGFNAGPIRRPVLVHLHAQSS